MKNIKLSTKLYLSFILILILLTSVIGIQIFAVNTISAGKQRLNNANKIKESTQTTWRWTLDYYDTNHSESSAKVEENYNNTKNQMESALSSYNNKSEQDSLKSMMSNLDAYHDSFQTYKGYVEKNDTYYKNMEDSSAKIKEQINDILFEQQISFKNYLKDTRIQGYIGNVDLNKLISQVEDKYDEVLMSNRAVIANLDVIISEVKYFLKKDVEYDEDVDKYLERMEYQLSQLYNKLDNDADKVKIDTIRTDVKDFIANYESYKGLLEAQSTQKEVLRESATEIIIATENLASAEEIKMNNDMSNAKNSALIFGFISIICGIALAFILSRNLVKQLTKNINVLSQSASQVSSASSQLVSAGQQLSQGSAEQAASIEETSATMNETSSMVKQNVENTRLANNLSKEASDAASQGSQKMQGMSKSMVEIQESSNEISKIIKVIDEIAFQTNMLALNAAVEAARAGEAGQGFAVVATEVRNLAQKSAQAAKNTADIIDRNMELSEQGVSISNDVNQSLNQILTKTQNVSQLIAEIAAASEEQSRGTTQVDDAITHIEKVVQSNAATAEESAASAEELQNQAKALSNVVSDLNKLINGQKNSSKIKDKSVKTKKTKKKSILSKLKIKAKKKSEKKKKDKIKK